MRAAISSWRNYARANWRPDEMAQWGLPKKTAISRRRLLTPTSALRSPPKNPSNGGAGKSPREPCEISGNSQKTRGSVPPKLEIRGKSGNELERGKAAVVANPRIDFKSPSRLLERTFNSALPNPLPPKQQAAWGENWTFAGLLNWRGRGEGTDELPNMDFPDVL